MPLLNGHQARKLIADFDAQRRAPIPLDFRLGRAPLNGNAAG
jgi:hypothetical protein